MHAVGKNKMFKIYCPTYLGRPRHGFVTSVCVLVGYVCSVKSLPCCSARCMSQLCLSCLFIFCSWFFDWVVMAHCLTDPTTRQKTYMPTRL